MTGPAETKVCPLCAETIKAAAKVCPHCRHPQSKWAFANPKISSSLWAIAGLTVWVIVGVFTYQGERKLFGPKEQFTDYHNQVTVVSSDFSFRVSGSNLWVTVVGTLTNRSEIGWKDLGVEAQFFDKSGRLIDAIAASGSDYRDLVILPHGEAAFKIETRAARPEGEYDTCKPTVRWARDGESVF